VRKPQDKAHVENLVKLTYQRIYTGLPETEVLTLDLLNQRVRQLLEQFNRGVLTGRSESRYDLWLREMPTLQQLPDQGYQLRTIRQVTVMKIAKADGTYLKEISRIERQQVLIIDDFGIQPLDAQGRSALMENVEDRHGKSSRILTSQLPVSLWHEIIGEQTIADAILDRLVHDAHRKDMKGEALRIKRLNRMDEINTLED
jgi:hypothetical protein